LANINGSFFALAATGLVTAVLAYSSSNSADVEAIKATEQQWNKDFQAENVDVVVAHYADDATLMAPGMAHATGKAAIRSALKDMMSDGSFSLHFQARRVEVARSGDMGFSEGAYTMTVTDPATKKPIHDKGSYVTTYRKQADGSWKAVSDIATSEVPPAAVGTASK
jgi:uncharacterized protein (TIGR02246 family)